MVKGIYKITNDRTGEVYIGQAKDLKRRENTHFRQLAQGKHHNSGLQKDHDNGDTFTFEILEEMPDATLADLKNKESHYINKFNSFREGYNQTPGGAMDQFKGRYEYGGGRLPVEKYNPTEKYLNKDIIYCSECGTKLELDDAYCSNCGEKIDRTSIDLQNNTIKKDLPQNKKEMESSKRDGGDIFATIVVSMIIIAFIFSLIIMLSDLEGPISTVATAIFISVICFFCYANAKEN